MSDDQGNAGTPGCPKTVTATVTSPGTIVSATVRDQFDVVNEMQGDGSSKTASVDTDDQCGIAWHFEIVAQDGTDWTFTIVNAAGTTIHTGKGRTPATTVDEGQTVVA